MTLTSVYVHFPWCLRKCPYCDFATRPIERDAVPHRDYADAVLREIAWRMPKFAGRTLASVFFGGGTPSLWEARELGRVLDAIQEAFPARSDDLEVTVECNPSSYDGGNVEELRAGGVNRLSIGVQSLADAQLEFLGRLHSAEEAIAAVKRGVGSIPRTSADLMFGMAGQPVDELTAGVKRLLDSGVRHVSAYSLTIEPNTAFGALERKGRLPVAPDDHHAASYLALERVMEDAAFTHYEVSNYARPGEESKHNLHYWRSGDYVGLGAAAVGCLTLSRGHGRRYRNMPDPYEYMRTSDDPSVEHWTETLGPQDIVREALMLGLRTAEGMNVETVDAKAGVHPERGRQAAVERRVHTGDLVVENSRWRVPHERWLYLDGIVADLF